MYSTDAKFKPFRSWLHFSTGQFNLASTEPRPGGPRLGQRRVEPGSLLSAGQIGEDNLFSVVRLGDLNHQDHLTIQTNDFITTDQRVWRINKSPENASASLMRAITAAALIRRS